jgi:hypothetical protein
LRIDGVFWKENGFDFPEDVDQMRREAWELELATDDWTAQTKRRDGRPEMSSQHIENAQFGNANGATGAG